MSAKVLIVDDDPDVLDLMEFKLAGCGYEVVRASNGVEALSKARWERPRLIVLDVMLPDLDGISVYEVLAAHPATRDIPVVICSALSPPMGRSRGARMGVSRWVTKSHGWEALEEHVRAALGEGG